MNVMNFKCIILAGFGLAVAIDSLPLDDPAAVAGDQTELHQSDDERLPVAEGH